MNRNRSNHKTKKVAEKRPERAYSSSTQARRTSTLASNVLSNNSVGQSSSRSPVTTSKRTIVRSLNTVLGRSNIPSSSLDRVFPTVSLPDHSKGFTNLNTYKKSTLSNGIDIITGDSPLPVTNIAVNVNVGSRYEGDDSAGLTHLLQHSILRSTTNRDVSTLIRDMGKLGADITAKAGRENLVLTATTPTKVNPVLGALRDVLVNPAYTMDDVARDLAEYKHDVSMQTADFVMDDVLHRAAFGPSGLGRSVHPTDTILSSVDGDLLKAWHKHVITADRISIAATGVEHDSFVQLAEEMFGKIAPSPEPFGSEQTEYHGTHLRAVQEGHKGHTHLALAFNAPSITSKHAAVAVVLSTILGDGIGLHGDEALTKSSRLYQNVYKPNDWINHVNSFYSPFSDAGLFGIYASTQPDAAGHLAHILLDQLKGLASVTDEEVIRAKNSVQIDLAKTLSSDTTRVEEMAIHIPLFKNYKTPEFVKDVEALTSANIRDVATQILSSPLTLATIGDSSSIPREFGTTIKQ